MRGLAVGVVLATIAMYLFGFLFWGASPLPYTAWQQSPDDRAAQAALKTHFPKSGTYFVPSRNNSPEQLEALYQAGPSGFVHIRHASRSALEPSVMVGGLLLTLAVALLLAVLMRLTLPAAPDYGRRVTVIAVVAITAVVMIHVGDLVWWLATPMWKLWQCLYDFVTLVIGGAVLAYFIRPQPTS